LDGRLDNAYVAAEVFQKAIENADVPAGTAVTRADLIKGLSMFKDETLGGITPPLSYGDGTKPNPGEPCFLPVQDSEQQASVRSRSHRTR